MKPLSYCILILLSIVSIPAFSQADTLRYWIEFTDKANNPYSLSEPLEFISPRAMERRVEQNIPLKENLFQLLNYCPLIDFLSLSLGFDRDLAALVELAFALPVDRQLVVGPVEILETERQRPSVRSPRRTSHASNGARIPPLSMNAR